MDQDIIATYFHLGLSYTEILYALALNHRIVISLRTLKRRLRQQRLFRRKHFTDILEVADFIFDQINESGIMHGYKWMHLKCLQAGKVVQRDTVYAVMKILDPDGLQLRRRGRLIRREYFARGPNYLWHLDSYDKLKTYGLRINGCIDGFSRQIVWLNVYRTSSDPKVIAGYYMEAVSAMEGCPSMIRGDMGTENGRVAMMQEFLSEQNSFIYGKSTHNQRIEAFWCMLRKECTQFWIDALKTLKDVGDFTGDSLDTGLVQFCFMSLVQNDLDRMSSVWNCHRIRRSKNQNVPNGRPVVLFSMPELFGQRDYLKPVDQEHIEACCTECTFRDGLPCDEELFELFIIYMTEHSLEHPGNVEQALQLYHALRDAIRQDLEQYYIDLYSFSQYCQCR